MTPGGGSLFDGDTRLSLVGLPRVLALRAASRRHSARQALSLAVPWFGTWSKYLGALATHSSDPSGAGLVGDGEGALSCKLVCEYHRGPATVASLEDYRFLVRTRSSTTETDRGTRRKTLLV